MFTQILWSTVRILQWGSLFYTLGGSYITLYYIKIKWRGRGLYYNTPRPHSQHERRSVCEGETFLLHWTILLQLMKLKVVLLVFILWGLTSLPFRLFCQNRLGFFVKFHGGFEFWVLGLPCPMWQKLSFISVLSGGSVSK